ncbi:hypothetical protein HDV03_001210 [Kappamyces sp. JEL0829]|nr:hypothetical protein HDV03_001210 [Kappamyces sp. JEL0829]
MISAASLLVFTLASANYLVFDPPTLQLLDSKLDNNIKVKLAQKPTDGNVVVSFEGAGITFDTCHVQFDDKNFDQWQTVHVNGVPAFTSQTQATIDVLASSCHNGTVEADKLPVTRQITPALSCTSIGDPHFAVFNGDTYTHFGKGGYYLFKSEHLDIQTIWDTWKGDATVNKAVAIRYGESISVLDVRKDFKSTMQQITDNKNGVVYTPPTDKNHVHKVALPDGSIINLTAVKDDYTSYINIDVQLAAGYENYGGHCNQKDAPKGKYFGRDGKLGTNLDTFITSWAVPASESLFDNKYTPSTPVQNTPGQICKLPASNQCVAPPPPPPVVVLPPYVPPPAPSTTAAPAASSSAAPSTSPVPCPPAYIEQVTQHCNELYNNTACAAILPTDVYIKACIADSITSGNYVSSEATRQAYLAKCNTLLTYNTQNPSPIIRNDTAAIQQSCGLGQNSCVNNCSNNGKCTDNGCVCNAGFTGFGCTIALAPKLSYNPAANAYTNNSPANQVAPIVYPASVTLPTTTQAPVQAYTQQAPVATTAYEAPAPAADTTAAPAASTNAIYSSASTFGLAGLAASLAMAAFQV